MSAVRQTSLASWQLLPMAVDDIPELLQIEQQVYEFPWTVGIFRDCLTVGYSGWVARDASGALLGYALMSMAAHEAHLLNLCVAPHFQRRGLAQALVHQVVQIAAHARAERLLLEVRASNKPALKLYRRLQFEQIGLRKGYYPASAGREDARVLALELLDWTPD